MANDNVDPARDPIPPASGPLNKGRDRKRPVDTSKDAPKKPGKDK